MPEREVDEQGYSVIRHINISVEGRSPRLTFAHEWGHYQEQMIRSKIYEILGRHPWHDLCPLEQAVEGAMTFRSTLSRAAMQLFDDLMLEDVLPENAAQTVQFAIDHGLLTEQPEVVEVAKAS